MKTLLIFVLDGVMDSSLAITIDTIRAARYLMQSGKPGTLRLVLAGHRKTIKTGAGMRIDVDLTFSEAWQIGFKADWIIVPGLGLTTEATIDARLQQADIRAAIALLQQTTLATRIGASCSAVFLLARAGLLEGRHATTTWWLGHLFRARYPGVSLDESRMLVRDGRMLTAGSAFAQLDLMLAVIAETMGSAAAEACSRYLLIDLRPSQARYMALSHVQTTDPCVAAAERWIDAHLSEPISVNRLADALVLSPKTLARRINAVLGLSPLKLVQRRRLMQAAHLIESSSLSIEAVAGRVGYQDGTALRKLIKREFGVTPGAMRL
jgi:transcriptional regulator GlxA family with amidase domain